LVSNDAIEMESVSFSSENSTLIQDTQLLNNKNKDNSRIIHDSAENIVLESGKYLRKLNHSKEHEKVNIIGIEESFIECDSNNANLRDL